MKNSNEACGVQIKVLLIQLAKKYRCIRFCCNKISLDFSLTLQALFSSKYGLIGSNVLPTQMVLKWVQQHFKIAKLWKVILYQVRHAFYTCRIRIQLISSTNKMSLLTLMHALLFVYWPSHGIASDHSSIRLKRLSIQLVFIEAWLCILTSFLHHNILCLPLL